MSDLGRALQDIRNIRRQLADSTEFRGYGPATLAATAAFAALASGLQSRWLRDPSHHVDYYILVWIVTAMVSASVIAVQTVTRSRRMHSSMADEMIRLAVEQFLPCVGVGALLTLVLQRYVPATTWMLPGLWQIVFSLGVFASCRFLPRATIGAAIWYLATGLACLSLGDNRALSAWYMGIPFAVGQLWVAGVLFFRTQELPDEA